MARAGRGRRNSPPASAPCSAARGCAAGRFVRGWRHYLLPMGRGGGCLARGAARRSALWTPRVWPGGVLIEGEIVGTWRRAEAGMTVQPWRWLSPAQREAVAAEAASLALPGVGERIVLRWDD